MSIKTKKIRSKPGKEVLKKLIEVRKEFDAHLKNEGDGMALSSCGTCRNFQGQIESLTFVIGEEY